MSIYPRICDCCQKIFENKSRFDYHKNRSIKAKGKVQEEMKNNKRKSIEIVSDKNKKSKVTIEEPADDSDVASHASTKSKSKTGKISELNKFLVNLPMYISLVKDNKNDNKDLINQIAPLKKYIKNDEDKFEIKQYCDDRLYDIDDESKAIRKKTFIQYRDHQDIYEQQFLKSLREKKIDVDITGKNKIDEEGQPIYLKEYNIPIEATPGVVSLTTLRADANNRLETIDYEIKRRKSEAEKITLETISKAFEQDRQGYTQDY